ncbi:cathelin [Tupaia chinensis]|uniref:cathelin n=1 Tax=Tupaia chinensis TaxID=246437 RepID=UPI0003C8CB68|nr:cathelin [Tupaia chinensis]
METQKASLSLGLWSLLLLGLVMPPASGQTLSYREAVLRAVDNYNQQSSEANLYRLLDLDQPPTEDEDPDTPKPVSFTVKETVCAKTTRRPPEQCDFKKNGLEKQCMGIVILDQAGGSSDISCTAIGRAKSTKLTGLLRRGGEKLAEKFEKIGQKIKNFFRKLLPETES